MPSSKRQPSKQKRASQNRAQRAALSVRRDAASAPSSTSSSSGSGGDGRSSLLGRLRGASFATPAAPPSGDRAADRAAARSAQPVGYRAALSGVMAAGAGLLLCLVFIKVPVTDDGDLYTKERLSAEWSDTARRAAVEAPDATADDLVDDIDEWAPDRSKDLLAKALWPYSAFIILPVIGAVLGFRAVSRRRPSKVISRAMFATLFGAFLTQGLFLIFLPSILALGVAMFQVRKYETAVAAAAATAVAEGGGDVIDADVIDADIVDDPDDPDSTPDVVNAEVVDDPNGSAAGDAAHPDRS
ncbi:MAG: hypothetical protein Q8K58_13995 [Acidimicrobiales bacterium]|nr:hypothetical protein [Acidimicrobiales bacterium]